MRLICSKYNLLVESSEENLTTIILENPETFSNFIMDVNEWINSGVGGIELYENNGDIFKYTKCSIVWNPFLIQMNTKPIINKIYKEMEQISNEEFWEKGQALNSEIIRYFDEILLKLPYPLEYSLEFKIEELCRIYKISFSEEFESVLEKICNYVKILVQVCGLKCLFFISLHDYLSSRDIQELIKTANYQQIHLFCIESHQREAVENEHTYLLDESDNIIRY